MIQRTQDEVTRDWPNDEKEATLSICCTTYNHEHYIKDALNSFLMQKTNFKFEILVRDDCSQDNTSNIIKKYVEAFPKIIKPIFESENQYSKGIKGLVLLFQKSNAPYLAICEGDDYWSDPDKLQQQVDFLEKHPDYVMTYTDVIAFNTDGTITDYPKGATKDLTAKQLQEATPINTLTTCFRNHFEQIPPEHFIAPYGDLFIWSYLGQYGKGKYISHILPSKYRVHKESIHSSQKRDVQLEMWLRTSMALYTYHTRLNNLELAKSFRSTIFTLLLQNMTSMQIIKQTYKEIKKKLKRHLSR